MSFFKFVKWLFEKPPSSEQYTKIVYANSLADIPQDPLSTIFVVRSGTVNKWVVFKCPDNCGRRVEVNLMKSRYPAWKVTIRNNKLSLWPSVIVDGCGSHFWMQNNQIEWSNDKYE